MYDPFNCKAPIYHSKLLKSVYSTNIIIILCSPHIPVKLCFQKHSGAHLSLGTIGTCRVGCLEFGAPESIYTLSCYRPDYTSTWLKPQSVCLFTPVYQQCEWTHATDWMLEDIGQKLDTKAVWMQKWKVDDRFLGQPARHEVHWCKQDHLHYNNRLPTPSTKLTFQW